MSEHVEAKGTKGEAMKAKSAKSGSSKTSGHDHRVVKAGWVMRQGLSAPNCARFACLSYMCIWQTNTKGIMLLAHMHR